MILFGIIQAWLLLTLSSLSKCDVMLAGKEEALRKLARNFVPQLVDLVSHVENSELSSLAGEVYGNPNVEYENQPDSAPEAEDLEYAAADEGKPVEVKKKIEVDLDELVEKVRARLLEEFKPRYVRSNLIKRPSNQDDTDLRNTDQGNEDYAPAVDSSRPFRLKRQPKAGRPQKTKHQVNKKSKKSSSKQPLRSTRKDKAGHVIESHDLYEKVKLSKKKNRKKDSYEDYLAQIKPKGEIFDMDEDDVNEPVTKKQEERSPSTGNDDIVKNKNQNNNMNRKVTRKTRPTENNNNDINGSKTKLRTTPHADQDENEDVWSEKTITDITSTVTHKALTEFIGGWDDDTQQGYQKPKPTEEVPMYPKKKTVRKIQTNMPIRQRYTISTPNYYDKLPRIAEKYNFDEPLPEKDREADTMKPIFKPPTNINGKVKV